MQGLVPCRRAQNPSTRAAVKGWVAWIGLVNAQMELQGRGRGQALLALVSCSGGAAAAVMRCYYCHGPRALGL